MPQQDSMHRTRFSFLSWLSGQPRSLDDLLRSVRGARERSLISPDVLTIVSQAIESEHRQVRDVMVPRTRMQLLESTLSLREALAIAGESRHSRYPVVGENADQIIGILLVKDMLSLLLADNDKSDMAERKLVDLQASLLRKPLLVPESKGLHSLLAEFRIQRFHMAIVMDEYGGTAGLVTLEDALEVIIGDIRDEHDETAEDSLKIEQLSSDDMTVDALTTVTDFNTYCTRHYGSDAVLSNGHFDTIGGVVTHALGHVPKVGEEVDLQGFYVRVLAADSRRAKQLDMRWTGIRNPAVEKDSDPAERGGAVEP